MAQEKLHLIFPIGRLVRGSLTERAKTDYDGNEYEEGKGPFEIGYAVRKDNPEIGTALTKMFGHAKAGYASRADIIQRMEMEWQSGFNAGTFRFKVRDGNKPNKEGRVNENTVDHWVFNLSTHVPFKCTYITGYGLPKFKNAQGVDIEPQTEIAPSLIKIGDYVHINIGMASNEKVDHTAGLYMNPNAIILAAYGEAITGGIDLATATAGLVIGALPTGATTAPIAGGAAPGGLPAPASTGAPGATAPGSTAPAGVGMPGLPATASPSNVAPHETFLQGPGAGATGGAGPGGMALPGV